MGEPAKHAARMGGEVATAHDGVRLGTLAGGQGWVEAMLSFFAFLLQNPGAML